MFGAIVGALPAIGEVKSANDFMKAIAPDAVPETPDDFDFLWGQASERSIKGGGLINPKHWTRFFVIDDSPEDGQYSIEGSVEHDMVGIGISHRNHYHLLDSTPRYPPSENSSVDPQNVVTDQRAIEQKKREMEKTGIDPSDNLEIISFR